MEPSYSSHIGLVHRPFVVDIMSTTNSFIMCSVFSVAALLAIQEAACLQRYDYHMWVALSRASVTLSSALLHTDVVTNSKTVYLENLSVDIITRTIALLKPHFKFKQDSGSFEPENIQCSDSAYGAVKIEDKGRWIISQLAEAVSNSDNQLYINSLSKPNVFYQFLTMLSCASCLWARYWVYVY